MKDKHGRMDLGSESLLVSGMLVLSILFVPMSPFTTLKESLFPGMVVNETGPQPTALTDSSDEASHNFMDLEEADAPVVYYLNGYDDHTTTTPVEATLSCEAELLSKGYDEVSAAQLCTMRARNIPTGTQTESGQVEVVTSEEEGYMPSKRYLVIYLMIVFATYWYTSGRRKLR